MFALNRVDQWRVDPTAMEKKTMHRHFKWTPFVKLQVVLSPHSFKFYRNTVTSPEENFKDYPRILNLHRVAKCRIIYTEQIFQTKFYPKKNANITTNLAP